MIIATLLAGAALQAFSPPAPPAPPALPAVAAMPLPPLPPLPPAPPRTPHGSQVMSFDADGRHVTIIRHRDGEHDHATNVGDSGDHVLRYKDADGRDVTVITDRTITQADAERMERDMRAKIPEITAKAMAQARTARADAEVHRRDALRYGEDARRQGEIARREGDKAREYAQVIVRQMKDKDGAWAFDGGRGTAVFRQGEFAGPADLKALRDEVHALREEVEALRAQLKSGSVQ